MKKLTHLLLSLVLFVPVFAGATPKPARAETREVSGFHGISSSVSYSVTVTLGQKESLSLTGDADRIKEIETIVENGILVIKNKSPEDWGNRKEGKVNISVTAKSLNDLSLAGSGSLSVASPLKTDDLKTRVSGSGKMKVSIAAKEYDSVVTGSGSIDISGSTEHCVLTITGSGSFQGREFKTGASSIRITGSGSADLQAEKSIDATLTGSGSVRYSGNARVSTKKTGSGSVEKI